MRGLVLMLISFNCLAGLSEISSSELYNYKKVRIKKAIKRKARIKSKDSALLKRLLESDQKIARLLAIKSNSLIVKATSTTIMPLTRVRATLLNSVLAMNVAPATTILKLGSDIEELAGAEVRCKAMSFQKRVRAKCDLLVLGDKSYQIDGLLWDSDGAEGLIADYFYTGEEKQFLTSSLANFFSSMLEGAKSKVSTPFGSLNKTTSKNQLFNGLMGVANSVNRKILDSSEEKIEISFVNAGKQAVLFFNSGLDLKE